MRHDGLLGNPHLPCPRHLAHQAKHYREASGDPRLFHVAGFDNHPEAVTQAAHLWALCRPWRAARLVVDGSPPVAGGAYWQAVEVVRCAAAARTLTPPSGYCTSGSLDGLAGMPEGRSSFPCRWLLEHHVARVAQVDWTDGSRGLQGVQTALLETGARHCPFLNLHPLEQRLMGRAPPSSSTLPWLVGMTAP